MREVGTYEEATSSGNEVPAEVEPVRLDPELVNFGDMSEMRLRVPQERRTAHPFGSLAGTGRG